MHQVAVGDSKDVLQASNVPFCFNIQRELLTSTNNTVTEEVAVVLSWDRQGCR